MRRGGSPRLSPEQKADIIRRGLQGDELVRAIALDHGISGNYASKLINHAKRALP
jgi:transposase-like protein